MNRNTIDFGIDLGTTNSEVAVIEGNDIRIFKNTDFQTENTPSAVHFDKSGTLMVGHKAKNAMEKRPDDVKIEFKRSMGLTDPQRFPLSGRVLSPEECSAEVLKSLRKDVEIASGEDVRAAVITVPAMFELPACDATRRAAEMAGIEHAVLLQEPIAAATAYGFSGDAADVYWLVYDLGGGTFDAALVSVRDGRLSVADHGGENHLGGKDFDWKIVSEIVAPRLATQYGLRDFNRENPAYRLAFTRLKYAAEGAKIELSRRPSARLAIDDLFKGTPGPQDEDVDVELTQAEYARLIVPLVEHSMTICRRTLERNRLDAGDIEKLILVGGPTLTPVLREMLKEGLKIPLDISIDPITAVARGAAIFAGSQMIPKESRQKTPVALGTLEVELAYEPITPDSEPFIGGKVTQNGAAPPAGCRIEFSRGDGAWKSGELPISATGAFSADLRLQERKPNTFSLEIRDAQGSRLETSLDSFTVTHGLGVDNPPLPRSLGVALADDRVQVYIAKDTQLPAQKFSVHRTARAITRGQGEAVITIPIIEGEHPRASRNRLIGTLSIPGHQLRRDLRAGAEIEVKIELDASRKLSISAHIPDLDQDFSEVQGQTSSQAASASVLQAELDQQKGRLRQLSLDADTVSGPVANEVRDILFALEASDALSEVEKLVATAKGGEVDAAKSADERLKDLAAELDRAEDLLEWPRLEAKAESELQHARDAVASADDSALRGQLATLEGEMRAALRARDKETVEARLRDADDIWFEARQRDPNFWVHMFHIAQEKPISAFTDPQQARRLLQEGDEALNRRDIPSLRRFVDQLFGLLPSHERGEMGPSFGSGVV